MMPNNVVQRARLSITGFIIFAAGFDSSIAAAAVDSPPRLVVVVAIDQFRGDYIRRFEPLFGNGGFRRIQREGFDYANCLYPTANTETGPGHASLLSGAYGHRSGIVQNEWFDAAEGKTVYCVEDRSVSIVSSDGPGSSPDQRPASPRRLLAGTVGDNLEVATIGAAKTVSLSLKDRAAALMGGHAADLATWFDQSSGEFVSSTFYVQKLPQWLIDFNHRKPADRWFQKQWTLSLPAEEYAKRCTPDDYPAESAEKGGYESVTFPHTLGWKSAAPDKAFYGNLYTSPYGNDLLLDLIKEAVTNESLGKDEVSDLLTLSFSSNDVIGHAFGPNSWEVMDATIKTDAVLADLMTFLDSSVGEGKWSLLLTGDHGVAEFPEVLKSHRIDAERVSQKALAAALETQLETMLGPPPANTRYVATVDHPWVTFNKVPEDPAQPHRTVRMHEAAVEWLLQQPSVAMATTVRNLLDRGPANDDVLNALRLSYYPGRSGEVAFTFKPNYLPIESKTGTGHGAVYRYDQSVPLLAIGQGIRHGRSTAPVTPGQIAPSVALLCGVLPPNCCEVAPLVEALAQP